MIKFRKLLPLAVCITILLSGCGTKKNTTASYNTEADSGLGTGAAAQNGDSELSWDDELKCVLFKGKDGTVWSTIPYEYMQSGGSSANVTSPLNLTVSDTDTLTISEIKGSSAAVDGGRVIAEETEGGIRVTYYFDEQKISVPVLYTLDSTGFSITLESERICEGANYKLLEVELAPYLCSAPNSEENYLFIPSNSGALMYTRSDAGGTRKYSGAVYGNDAAYLYPTPQDYEAEVKMPVFGARNGNNALFAIVESGDEHITVKAEAGNSRTGWSAVWPEITVRGTDVVETQLPQSRLEDISYVSEDRITDNVTVKYIPLYGAEADYNGMARCYREYLTENKLMKPSEKEQSPYSITLYGGAQLKKLFLGIPYNKTVCLTSFNDTAEIIDTLTESTGIAPEVQLIGYGKSGIDIGKVGGGFSFAKSLGSSKDLKNLLKLCEEKGVAYYFDYDIVRYNKSSRGFSTISDMAKTASDHSATLNTVDVALAGFTDTEYYLLSRDKLYDAAEKIIKLADKKSITGVSLNTLSSMSYSDYTDSKTAAKGNMGEQVTEITDSFKKNGISFSASNPSIYSALAADSIFDLTAEADYNALDTTVPFYQMVLSGSRSIYTNAVNTSDSPKQQIMLAAAYGMGLNFECIGSYNVDVDLNGYSFYGAVFESQKDTISGYVKEYLDTFSKIQGAAINEYRMLTSQISRTAYSNGVTVYANHSDSTAAFGSITLPAYGYKVAEQ